MLVYGLASAGMMAGADALPSPRVFDALAFGAVADGTTLNTKALQRAIDRCGEAGGGVVYFPPGVYLSGTLVLKSGVTLHLENGSTLLGSPDLADYPAVVPGYRSYTDQYTDKSLLYAENAERIGITGRGEINGNGAKYRRNDAYKRRPYLIRFITCRDVVVEDVTLADSAMWLHHYLACDDVRIEGVTVRNRHANTNNDGVDIDDCHRVRIANCDFFCEDDAITIKSTSDRGCRDIVVENCVVSSLCNAIKLGTESNGGFENIKITGCTVYDTGNAGIALEMVDGGRLERVVVSDIVMNDVGTAIFLRHGARNRPFKEDQPPIGVGRFRGVIISNVVAHKVGKTGCSVVGLPDHPVENVTISNVDLEFLGGGTREDAHREAPEHATRYPEFSMFGTLPAYGFYVRHATAVTFDNIRLRYAGGDARPAFVADDVGELELVGLAAKNPTGDEPLLRFKDVRGAMIRGCRLSAPHGTFLEALGGCEEIALFGNDLRRAKTPVELGADVPGNAVAATHNLTP